MPAAFFEPIGPFLLADLSPLELLIRALCWQGLQPVSLAVPWQVPVQRTPVVQFLADAAPIAACLQAAVGDYQAGRLLQASRPDHCSEARAGVQH